MSVLNHSYTKKVQRFKPSFALLVAACFVFSSSFAKASSPIEFDLGHTVQVCQHPGHQKTWCDGAPGLKDIQNSAQASGLNDRILSQLEKTTKNPESAHIYAAEFSFSNKIIQRKMCELGKLGVKIDLFVDAGSSKDIVFLQNADCQKNPKLPNAQASILGGFVDFPNWRLHHNKTLVIDPGDGSSFDIDFSSGNLSVFGTSLHMDHWVFMQAPASSNLARAELCLFEGLAAANVKATVVGMYKGLPPDFSHDNDVISTYMQTRDACYTKNKVIPMLSYETALAKEDIAPFFTPNTNHAAITALSEQIQNVIQQKGSRYIYIAMEHFSNRKIAALLRKAAEADVDVRIIFNSSTVTGSSEVASDKPFMEQNLRHPGIHIRFIETNSNAGGNGQQMHNKFAILNGARVFSGAGHFTSAGLENNFETLYLTQNADLTRKYLEYFQELWTESVEENYF